MIEKRVIAFSKLAVFRFLMGLSENFPVRIPKCRFDDKHHKSS